MSEEGRINEGFLWWLGSQLESMESGRMDSGLRNVEVV